MVFRDISCLWPYLLESAAALVIRNNGNNSICKGHSVLIRIELRENVLTRPALYCSGPFIKQPVLNLNSPISTSPAAFSPTPKITNHLNCYIIALRAALNMEEDSELGGYKNGLAGNPKFSRWSF